MKRFSTKTTNASLIFVALTAAITSILSQLAVPLPTGVPATLQTFAFALIGYTLLPKLSLYSILLYLLLGAIGLPVFANFRGGFMHFVGFTGGFLWGSILFVPLAGFGAKCKHAWQAIFCGLAGLFLLHAAGIVQYAFLTQNAFRTSFFLVSFPYIAKDILSVIGAFFASRLIRKRLIKNGIFL